MSEQIYTFSDEEIERMFKSGEIKLLTSPAETVQKTPHEKALEKAKKLFGEDFEDVFSLRIGGRSPGELRYKLAQEEVGIRSALLGSLKFNTLPGVKGIEIVKINVLDLGFKKHTSTERIFLKAKKLGLELCPSEVGPYFVLAYKEDIKAEELFVGMKPILNGLAFSLGKDEFGLFIDDNSVLPEAYWGIEEKLLFVMP